MFATLRAMTYSTAFGSPVVPPVQDRNESSGERCTRSAGSCAAIRSSYACTPPGADAAAAPTSTVSRRPDVAATAPATCSRNGAG